MRRFLLCLTVLLAGASALVGLTNFVVITWGAPAGAAEMLAVQPDEATLPYSADANAPLWAPGRSIIHQHRPQSTRWLVATIGQAIGDDCRQTGGCDVVLLSCLPSFDKTSFSPSSILLAISTSPSLVSSEMEPISLRYILTGSETLEGVSGISTRAGSDSSFFLGFTLTTVEQSVKD